MRSRARLMWVLWVFPIVGCAEVTTDDELQFQVTLHDWFEDTRVLGAEMCVAGTANCVTEDGSGYLTLAFPVNERVSWTFIKDGYAPLLSVDVTEGGFETPRVLYMFGNERLAGEFTRLGARYPPTDTGAVFIGTFPSTADVTFRLVDANGTRYYSDEEGHFQSGLEATTSDGAGGFVNVSDGDFQVEFGNAEGCSLATAAPGDSKDRMSLPVREGYITYASIICAVSAPP